MAPLLLQLVLIATLATVDNTPRSPPEDRTVCGKAVKDVVSKMSFSEKIGQMSQVDVAQLLDDEQNYSPERVEYYFGKLAVGSVLNKPLGTSWNATAFRSLVLSIRNTTRTYGLPPVLYGLDSVHGAGFIQNATLTPQQINLASSFNVSVAYQAGMLASRDTRAAGISWLFSPILGLAVQPLWSRVFETFGECPTLVSAMGRAIISGIQQPGDGTPSRAAACAKHFVAYSKPKSGHDRAGSWIPTRYLHQYFLRPWKTPVLTIMTSYTDYDGVPNVANPRSSHILRNIHPHALVVTDYHEIFNLIDWHHNVNDKDEAVKLTLRVNDGVDMSMVPKEVEFFQDSVRNSVQGVIQYPSLPHVIPEERITKSAERVLTIKCQLHMLNETLNESNINIEKVGSQEDRRLALDMAHQGIVLVKNNIDTLPITATLVNILVTGPTAHSIRYQSGGWSTEWEGALDDSAFSYGTTVLDAAKKVTTWNVTYSCGVDISGGACRDNRSNVLSKESASDSIKAAVDAITSGTKYIIVCVGEENYAEKPGDIRDLSLQDGQVQLVRTLKAAAGNAKIILVYFGGRTRLLGDIVDDSDAVFVAFLPGPDAGQAVIDLITGTYNPSGRLPITYPKYPDGAGAPYWHLVSEQCTKGNGTLPHMEYGVCDVEWPFGHGLSYTTFHYSELTVSSNRIVFTPPGRIKNDDSAKEEEITISVKVTNTGPIPGSEVVLFFTFDESRYVTPEYKMLHSFEKIHLRPGESQLVTSTIQLEDMRYIGPNDDVHFVLQPGMRFQVGVGYDSDCRALTTPDISSCTDFITVTVQGEEEYYAGACDIACHIWSHSNGCDEYYNLSPRKCWDMCMSIATSPSGKNQEGWGWNYVQCIESVVEGIAARNEEREPSSCSLMTTLCRDIFHTSGLDEFGFEEDGIPPPSGMISRQQMTFAFVGFFISSVIIVLSFLERQTSKKYSQLELTSYHSNQLILN